MTFSDYYTVQRVIDSKIGSPQATRGLNNNKRRIQSSLSSIIIKTMKILASILASFASGMQRTGKLLFLKIYYEIRSTNE